MLCTYQWHRARSLLFSFWNQSVWGQPFLIRARLYLAAEWVFSVKGPVVPQRRRHWPAERTCPGPRNTPRWSAGRWWSLWAWKWQWPGADSYKNSKTQSGSLKTDSTQITEGSCTACHYKCNSVKLYWTEQCKITKLVYMLGSRATVNVFKNVTLSNSPKQNKQERMKLKTKLHNWRVISF